MPEIQLSLRLTKARPDKLPGLADDARGKVQNYDVAQKKSPEARGCRGI
jgi:hypothetical protein